MANEPAADIARLLKELNAKAALTSADDADLQNKVRSLCETTLALARIVLSEHDLKVLGIRPKALKWDPRLTLDEAIEGWTILETPNGAWYKTLNDPYLSRVLHGAGKDGKPIQIHTSR